MITHDENIAYIICVLVIVFIDDYVVKQSQYNLYFVRDQQAHKFG